MILNNNLSILPWYSTVDMQNHRKSYSYGEMFPLFSPERKLLPFQIVRQTRVNEITDVHLYNLDGTLFLNITDAIKSTGLSIIRHEQLGYDIIKYPGMLRMAIDMPEGLYYALVCDGAENWFSEVFSCKHDLSGCLKLEYWDFDNFEYEGGEIDYTNLYRNTVYLQSEVGRPDYNFDETGEKRDGLFFVEKQISEKVYKFTFLAPEYLCDALRLVRMHDYIQITSNNIVYQPDSFLITPKWQDGGYVASVDCEFECATIVKKIGRAIVQPIPIGSFNDDYNESFEQ